MTRPAPSRLVDSVRRLPPRVLRYMRRKRERYLFRRAVESTPPIVVTDGGKQAADAEIHVLSGGGSVYDLIAAAKSLYRFLDVPLPLIVHEDGSFRESHFALLARHLPGTRVVRKAIADAEINAALDAQRLPRCRALRDRLVLALKLFDFEFYGRDKRILSLDTDVLFFERPDDLLSALRTARSDFRPMYNEDITSMYTWTPDAVVEELGFSLLPRVNSGLTVVTRTEPTWDLYEQVLAMPQVPDSNHYAEQSLQAIVCSRDGGLALPPRYDVCFRHARHGVEGLGYYEFLSQGGLGARVISQHYCGGEPQRRLFYTHFTKLVAPELRKLYSA